MDENMTAFAHPRPTNKSFAICGSRKTALFKAKQLWGYTLRLLNLEAKIQETFHNGPNLIRLDELCNTCKFRVENVEKQEAEHFHFPHVLVVC